MTAEREPEPSADATPETLYDFLQAQAQSMGDAQPSAGAVRDARAARDEANERAAKYRAALFDLRTYLREGSEGDALLSRVLAPGLEPWVYVAPGRTDTGRLLPALLYHYPRCPELTMFDVPLKRCPRFVAQMVGAEVCSSCSPAAS